MRFAIVLAVFLASVTAVAAQEPTFTTLSAGWSLPADGPVKDAYQSGFTAAASFRTPVAVNVLYGFEVGDSWFSLDTDKLEEDNPNFTFSGGDMGLLSITGENDFIMGAPENTIRPFVNSGLGFFRSFIDDTKAITRTAPPGATRHGFFHRRLRGQLLRLPSRSGGAAELGTHRNSSRCQLPLSVPGRGRHQFLPDTRRHRVISVGPVTPGSGVCRCHSVRACGAVCAG